MPKAFKAVGALLILYSIGCFIVNVGIWRPWVIGDVTALWNPLSLLTPLIVGDIPIISGTFGWILNGVFGIIVWPFITFVIGLIFFIK